MMNQLAVEIEEKSAMKKRNQSKKKYSQRHRACEDEYNKKIPSSTNACIAFAKTGRCAYGHRCKYVHGVVASNPYRAR